MCAPRPSRFAYACSAPEEVIRSTFSPQIRWSGHSPAGIEFLGVPVRTPECR